MSATNRLTPEDYSFIESYVTGVELLSRRLWDIGEGRAMSAAEADALLVLRMATREIQRAGAHLRNMAP